MLYLHAPCDWIGRSTPEAIYHLVQGCKPIEVVIRELLTTPRAAATPTTFKIKAAVAA